MIKEFSSTTEYLDNTKHSKQTQTKFKNMLQILGWHVQRDSKILDVGDRNPFTELMEREFMVDIDNTKGDLDDNFYIAGSSYDVILASHIVEHIFNPLYCLQRLKEVLSEDGIMIIAVPQRGKLLWCKGHFHEIDDYRIRLLFKRAGLKVIKKYKRKVKREWWRYLTGFRPILRLFFEYNAIYIVKVI